MRDRDYRRKQREGLLTPEENTDHLIRTGQLEIVNEYRNAQEEDTGLRISVAAGLTDIVPYAISDTEFLGISSHTIANFLGITPDMNSRITYSSFFPLNQIERRLFSIDCAEDIEGLRIF